MKKKALRNCDCYPFKNVTLIFLSFYQINTDAQLAARGIRRPFLKIKKKLPYFGESNGLIDLIYGLDFQKSPLP